MKENLGSVIAEKENNGKNKIVQVSDLWLDILIKLSYNMDVDRYCKPKV